VTDSRPRRHRHRGADGERARVAAAIDIGSNSVHLLVAALAGDGVRAIVDVSALIGLGDVVDREGVVTRDARDRLAAAVRDQVAVAREAGAASIVLVATEPLRRAADAADVASELAGAVGLPLHVLTHAEEAELTLLGVTGGHRPPPGLLVVDVGGGSSEVIVAGTPPVLGVLRTGSARLTAAHLRSDPPTADEIVAVRSAALSLVAALPPAGAAFGIAVGGTATNLIRVADDGAGGLGRAEMERLFAVVARLPADEVASRFRVNRRRAGQLAAGAAILDAIMDRYALDRLDVSPASLREGAIVAEARAGAAWRDWLPGAVLPEAR
jgi:exopolyphosphatase/pppGpp-phosphohydrolase